jgi:hypothetical protein
MKEQEKKRDVIWYIEEPTDDMTIVEKEKINKRIGDSEWLKKRFMKRTKWNEEEKTKLIVKFYDYIEQCHNETAIDFDYILNKKDATHMSRFNIRHTSTEPDNSPDKVEEHIIIKKHSLDISHIKCIGDLHQDKENKEIKEKKMDPNIFKTWKMVYTLLLNYPFCKSGVSFQGMPIKGYKETGVLKFQNREQEQKKSSGLVYEIIPDTYLDSLIRDCFAIDDTHWKSSFGSLNILHSSFKKNVLAYSHLFFGKKITYQEFKDGVKCEVKGKDKVENLLLKKKLDDTYNNYGEIKESYKMINILKMEIEKEKNEFLDKETKMEKNISKRKSGIYINNEFQEFTIGNDRSLMLENVNKYFKDSCEPDKVRKNVIIYRLLGRYPSFYGMCYSSVGFLRPLDKTEVHFKGKLKGKLKYLEGEGEYYKDGIFHFPKMNMYYILTEEDKEEIEIYTKNKKIKIGEQLFNNNWETFRKQVVINSKEITGKKYLMKNFREDTKDQITLS